MESSTELTRIRSKSQVCVCPSCASQPCSQLPLFRKILFFFKKAWWKRGLFQSALWISPASWGLFLRKAAVLPPGKAWHVLQDAMWEVHLGRELLWDWGPCKDRARSPGWGHKCSSALATCAGGASPQTGPVPPLLPAPCLPFQEPAIHCTQRYVNLWALTFFFFFLLQGYKFGLGFSSDKACDYASALFTGSGYLLFVCCGR